MDSNLPKSVKILVSEQIVLAAIFYFGQAIKNYCRSSSKNVLESFLLIRK